MSTFLQLLISGLVAGAIYSLYATGITLLYSTTGIYNFAFGAVAFTIGLAFYELHGEGIPVWLCFVLSVFVLGPLLGLALEKIVFRDLAKASETARMVGSVGLVVALPALAFFVVERLILVAKLDLASLEFLQLVPGIGPTPAHNYRLFDTVTVNSDQVICLVVAFVMALVLWLLVARTTMGLHMRALVDRRELAMARGVDPARMSRTAWVMGSVLAGLAGVVGNPLFGLSQVTVLQFVIVASAVVVLARFRSLPVSFVGGLVLGAAVNLIAGYARRIGGVGDVFNRIPGLSSASVYLLLFFGLYFLGRQTGRAAGVSSSEAPPADYLADLSPWRRMRPWVIAGVLLFLWAMRIVPIGNFQAGPVEQSLIVAGLASCLVFLSFTVVTGMGGMVSLAQATFVTAGALLTGYVAHHDVLGGSFLVALVAGTAFATLLGIVVAIPALRLGGVSLALATLALAFVGETILFRMNLLNNNSYGWVLTRPKIGPIDFENERTYIVLLALIVAGAFWVVGNLERSATGRAMFAVRSAAAAAASGVSPVRTKLAVFAVSAALAGMGGVLMTYGDRAANDAKYPTTVGLLWLTIAVTWGVRRRGAAILAGFIGALFPRVIQTGLLFVPGTRSVHIPAILFGLGAIGLARNPDGVLHVTAMENYKKRQKKAAAKAAAAAAAAEGTPAPEVASAPLPTAPTPAVPAVPAVALSPDGGAGAALALRGVRSGYGDIEVLHGVDIDVPPASIVALVGANGAGKSTLCQTAAGLIAPTAGTVHLGGDDVTLLTAHQRARAGLILAPESRGIFPALAVDDNLRLWLPLPEQREQVFDRFPVLGARRKLPAGNLSGGEQQMLCLAPLLVRPPKVLVADEPTLGLAPLVVSALLEVFSELRADGTSLLLVEEKLRAVVGIADVVTFLRLGVVTWSGPAAEVTEAHVARYYLTPHEHDDDQQHDDHERGAAKPRPLTTA